jgi:hypothetical protein
MVIMGKIRERVGGESNEECNKTLVFLKKEG